MEQVTPIEIVYSPGTWGNCLRWLLDKFSGNPNFKDMQDPWDNDDRVHGFKSKYSDRFSRAHQEPYRGLKQDPNTRKIIIEYAPTQLLFVERLAFYRTNEKQDHGVKNLIKHFPKDFLRESFGERYISRSVAKELCKIQFHDGAKHQWWNSMMTIMSDPDECKFNIEAFWNKDMMIDELEKISQCHNLNLAIEHDVVDGITAHIGKNHVVTTRTRAHHVLDAVKHNKSIDCNDLDIIEQAYIEVVLEKQNDCVIFPFGTNWFSNTSQITDFITCFPGYLKHMNPRLPWYNGQKNPFYLTGQIDKSK